MNADKRFFSLNKLVRDKMPEIMKSCDIDLEMKTLNQEEFLIALKKKLIEEAKEVFEATSKEEQILELADVMEAIDALASQLNISKREIEKKRRKKNIEKGGFLNKIFIDHISMDKSNKYISYFENKGYESLKNQP